ncbi:MAG: hypothetical protein U0414_12430 [Polyangiaceae bacterium]
MNDPDSAKRSANAVLRSVVSPALGIAVGALLAAGAVSACAGTNSNGDDSTIERVGSVPAERPGMVGERGAPPPDTSPSAAASLSAATSVSPPTSASAPPTATVPKPGMPKPGEVPPPKVGQVPAPGVVAPPGFSGSGFVRSLGAARPTRLTRQFTDADPARLRGVRSIA